MDEKYGIYFVDGQHLVNNEAIYLHHARFLGMILFYIHQLLLSSPEIKSYIPDILNTDLFIIFEEDNFILLISPSIRGHLPTRGMRTKYTLEERKLVKSLMESLPKLEDVSDSPVVKPIFEQLSFSNGFAVAGTYPLSKFGPESQAERQRIGQRIASLIKDWAVRRKSEVENSKIFLSHKGVNKSFVGQVDLALRTLGLKTWFDRDDLSAGDTLVRGVDDAFDSCIAAVFFISGDYVDSGVISKEIDRAIHEEAFRDSGFTIIPLVLAEHAGTDDQVPAPLKKLVWKTVKDIDVVTTILRSLPQNVLNTIKYTPIK